MTRYLLGRIVALLFSIWVVSVIVFVTLRAVPGGPWDQTKMPLPPEAKANILRKYGLDKPLLVQYWNFIKNAVRFDFGVSYQNPTYSVIKLIGERWPATAMVGLPTVAMTFIGGMTLGIIAALRRNTIVDYVITFFSVSAMTIPNFVVAIWLILIFSIYFEVLPPGGWGTPKHLIMPVIAYGLAPMALVARITRLNMLEAMAGDYVRTARAKGLLPRIVIMRHVMKNALIPIVTLLLPIIPDLMTGSIFIEQTFTIPGLGRYWVTSILDRDYPVVMALMLLIAVVWGTLYLITDILYVAIDPRVRLRGRDAGP